MRTGGKMDYVGQLFWFSMFVTPLLTVPLVWKYNKSRKIIRIFIGLILALFLSLFLYIISILIIFREGMGS